MWLLTKTYNEYDQFGDYIETAWLNKPTRKELNAYFKGEAQANFITHLLNGGGRRETEDQWFHLTELKEGEKYQHKY